jgi:hypothetical protein
MKKTVQITLVIVGAFILLTVISALLISPVTKHYIEKNSKDLVGRVVIMDQFRFNLFAGSLKVVGFDMKERDGQESFCRFDTLAVKVKLFDFLRHKVTVRKIHLSELHLSVWQKGNQFNFDDVMRKFASTDTVAKSSEKSSKTWEIGIYDIQLRTGNIFYKDLAVDNRWDMRDLNLKIPGVYFSGQETDIGFNLLFADGGKLASSLQYNIEKSTFHIQLDLENFSIGGILPYLQQSMRLGSLTGLLDAHIRINGDTQHIMNSMAQGKLMLRKLNMHDDRQQLVLTADSLSADMKEISMAESKYLLNGFSARGISTMYVTEKDSSSNFTYLLKESVAPPDPETVKQQSAPVRLAVGTVDLQGIRVEFRDRTLQAPFTYEITKIAITAKDFDPDKSNDINIKGKLGATGMINIRWVGGFNDISNFNLKVNLNDVEMKDFTPYSLEYFAYPITAGILTFTSQNTIVSGMLKGVNGVDIFKCSVDKVSKDVNPMMKVPLRLAVYVLKDRNDKIMIDLPVEGDIRSPQFSYRKIIIKTLTNLLVKVSLTPLDFLAGSMGFKPDRLDAIEFSPLQEDFTSAQYDRLNQLNCFAVPAKGDVSIPDFRTGVSI